MAAHDRGLVVVAHVNSVAGVGKVVSAGVDVVAHVPVDGELDTALAERIAEAGIAVGPTQATTENFLGEPGGAAVAADPRLAGILGDAQVQRLTSGLSGRRGQGMPPYSRAEENVSRLADAGVTILAGTDAPNPGTIFGASLHRELELLARCGLTPAQALKAATAAPARVFNLADRGHTAAGAGGRPASQARADFLLVRADHTVQVVNVKPAARLADPAVAESLAWPGPLFEAGGWDHEIWSGASPVLLANVRFLASYRRPGMPPDDVTFAVLGEAVTGERLSDLLDRLERAWPRPAAKAAVLRLLWQRRLSTDLSRPLDADSAHRPA